MTPWLVYSIFGTSLVALFVAPVLNMPRAYALIIPMLAAACIAALAQF
ncbi:MAG: hypothetical protein QNJ09_18495 [Paracoccaceae bacterium]|nr:hypothetical protein [Paracoccaceae bacterium]